MTLSRHAGQSKDKAQDQEERDESKRKKILAIFPWSGKKSQQRESEESSPGEEKTRGKRKGKERDRVKPQGSEVTIFYSQSKS